MPSAQGIKEQLENILGDQVGESGDKTGKTLGSRLVSGLKTVVAAAGIGKMFQSALTEGANVEQSIGGIETLFKKSADKVIESAQNAYKTAGMSANQYMETVTGFSASLLQGLSGDTEKAAEVADMALTDMSDNTNKMGSDMESIKNAYQGFAKGQYQLLDNLKLGYGGTKTEMERLLKDAQEISGVEYDINNLSDVYNAIHVIQEEMGITGTTAKEASETLSGSFAAMKGAVQTFLGNVTIGADVSDSFNAILSTTKTFLFDNLLPMTGNVITGVTNTILTTDWAYLASEMLTDLCFSIGGAAESTLKNDGSIINAIIAGINEKLPQIVKEGGNIINTVISGIDAKFPQVLKTGADAVLNLVTGILGNIPKVLDSAGEVASNFIGCIMDNAPKVLQTGGTLILKLVKGVINNLPEISSAAVKLVLQLLTTVLTNAPKMAEGGLTLIGKLTAGIIRAVPTLLGKMPGIISDIKEQFISIKWGEIGNNIIEGIAKGITNGVTAIIDAAKNAAKSALNAAKKALDINSPSGAFEDEVGGQSMDGWVLGIKNKKDVLLDTLKSISKETIGVVDLNYLLSNGASGISEDSLVAYGNNLDLKGLGEYILAAMEECGDKQVEALIEAISSMKMLGNNREIARFLSDLGFARG